MKHIQKIALTCHALATGKRDMYMTELQSDAYLSGLKDALNCQIVNNGIRAGKYFIRWVHRNFNKANFLTDEYLVNTAKSSFNIPCGLKLKRNKVLIVFRKMQPVPSRWYKEAEEIKNKLMSELWEKVCDKNGVVDLMKAEEYLVSDGRFFSDRMRYIALKRGGFKCAFCGATADEERLEVDHVIPYDRGGPTSIANSRVVCGKCNRGVYHAEQKHTHKEYCNK